VDLTEHCSNGKDASLHSCAIAVRVRGALSNVLYEGVAEWSCNGLQLRLCRFNSDLPLQVGVTMITDSIITTIVLGLWWMGMCVHGIV
jgi:hypothetical protein